MENCGSQLLKSALVAFVLVAVAQSGSAAEKLATCCKTVTKQEITEPITGFLLQKANPPCVQAVIFQTETGLFCSQLNAPWVRRKIMAFRRANAQATPSSVVSSSPVSSSVVSSSPVSLLSIITSTASPSSSSTPLFSSTRPLTSSTSPSSTSRPLSPSSTPPSSSSLPLSSSTFEMPAGETFSGGDDE